MAGVEVDPGLFKKTGLDAGVKPGESVAGTPLGAMAGGQASSAPRGAESRDYVVLRWMELEPDDDENPVTEQAWVYCGIVHSTSRTGAWGEAVGLWPWLLQGTEEQPVRAQLVPVRYWQEITAGSKLEPFVEGL